MPLRHAPPAVRYPLNPPRVLAACLCGLWLLAALLLLIWAMQFPAGNRPAVAVLGGLAAAVGLRQGWRGLCRGVVLWDGEQWWICEAGRGKDMQPISLQVRADGGRWLWAQAWQAGGSGAKPWRGTRWLLLRQRQSPETWGELRRAVYFPPRPSERPQ